MTLSSKASASVVNLAFGLFLTFMAPVFSQQIGLTTVIAYLLANSVYALRQNELILATISLTAAAATFMVDEQNLHWVIGAWAALTALTLFRNRNINSIFGQRLDQRIGAGLATLLFLAELITVLDLRAVLGFFAAYLLVSGVFMGIGAASQSK